MAEQNYKNHVRFDPVYHFVLAPVVGANVGIAAARALSHPGFESVWVLVMALALALIVLKLRLYPLRVQDRLIRLEETLRMQRVLPEELRGRIGELTPQQFVGLRFASDEELAGLVKRALEEKLGLKEIKQAVANWRADDFRV
jgi:low affinity Fe/Cu permease